jgi:alkylated DNA repair dioxygenase AlkB
MHSHAQFDGIGDQLDLFAAGEPLISQSTSARRVRLDDQSWVEHVPGWLSGNDAVFVELLSLEGWEQRKRWMFNRLLDEPRLTTEFRDIEDAPAPILKSMCTALSARYGVGYDQLWLNLYRNHHDSTSWHGDWPSCKRTHCIVPVLSLGAPRRFLLKPRKGGPRMVLEPAGGDLIVMGGRCQLDWRHSIPKQAKPAGPRISVNFQSTSQMVREQR